MKVKHSGTGIKHGTVGLLYTTSNVRGFGLKYLLRYTLTSEFQVTGKNAFSAMNSYNPQAHKV